MKVNVFIKALICLMVCIGLSCPVQAAETSPYMGGDVNLTFPTVINHQYTVQYKTKLSDASWNSLVTTNGTGMTITVLDPANTVSRLYRLSTQ